MHSFGYALSVSLPVRNLNVSIDANYEIGMRPYLGRQVTDLEMPQVVEFLEYVFWGQIIYVWSIPVIKFSILAFYWRLFSVAARVPILAVSFIVFSWLMALVSSSFITCAH